MLKYSTYSEMFFVIIKFNTTNISSKSLQISCPERIRNETKYREHRNQFIFNIGLVLQWEGEEEPDDVQKEYYRSSPLVPLVKKISQDLRALEVEYNYLRNGDFVLTVRLS